MLPILSVIIFNILWEKASDSSSSRVVNTTGDLNVDILITINQLLNEKFLCNFNLAKCVNELTKFILVCYLIQLFIEISVKKSLRIPRGNRIL